VTTAEPACPACVELEAVQASLRLLRETRETRLLAAEAQSRAAMEEVRRLDAEVRRLRAALSVLSFMASESQIPTTMRTVIQQALKESSDAPLG